MGGKAKIILPLVALGAAAVATGGFGLAGAGAAGSAGTGAAAATTGAAAATTTATAGGLTATQAGLFAGANATAMGSATAGLTAAQAATFAPALAPSFAAETGFFASLGKEFAAMSTLDKFGMGLKGVAAAGSIGGTMMNAEAQKAAIAFQENELKLSQSADGLEISEAELDSQKRLRRVLSAQGNFFSSTGISGSEGSAARLADAAYGEADAEMDLLQAKRDLSKSGARNVGASFALQRRRAVIGSAGGAFGSLLDFGGDALGSIERRRGLGR